MSSNFSSVRVTISLITASVILSAAIISCAAGNTEEQFVSLFDGKTLDGWHLMNNAQFAAEDGVIKLNGGSGWLRSEKEYSDFILQIEFRFLKPEQDGGVFLRAKKESENWPENYELQVENTNRMAKIWGAEHDLNVDLVQKVLKPIDEWNEYDIKLVGSKIEVRLNGELVSTSEDMGGLTKGYIGLQGENGFHEYRNIRIKDLSK
jgi:hypothetical protein